MKWDEFEAGDIIKIAEHYIGSAYRTFFYVREKYTSANTADIVTLTKYNKNSRVQVSKIKTWWGKGGLIIESGYI